MYIFVRKEDNVIVGSSTNRVSEADMERQGRTVYQIDDKEFNIKLIGQKLVEYSVKENIDS